MATPVLPQPVYAVTETYLDLIFGDRPGYVALAFGRDPYRTAEGRYQHRDRAERQYPWPSGRNQVLADAASAISDGRVVDTYVCPAARATPNRRKGGALPLVWLWADLDGAPADEVLLRRLEPLTVHSGQPGHRHAYVALAESVDVATHAALNKALAARLGADAKWSDESLLRLPGTLNHKPAVPVNGAAPQPPAPVVIEPDWSGKRWDVAELAALLGVDLSVPADIPVPAETVDGEPVDLTTLPATITGLLADAAPADRSAAAFVLVKACRAAGFTQGQTVTIANSYQPAVEKYGARVADDVARSWPKAESEGERQARFADAAWGPGASAELQARFAAQAAAADGSGTPAAGEVSTEAQEGSAPPAPAQARVAGGVRRVMARAASSIEPERVRWLWDGRLPLGALSLLGGREGIGKSTCAYQIVADITRGTLAGEFYGAPRAVAVAATEDSWPHTVVPRLMAAGADLDKVFRVDAQTAQDVETGLVLPEDLAGLKLMMKDLGAVLLLLDPLLSRLAPNLDSHKDADVRQALEPLVKAAQDCDASVLGIIHVNKSNSTDPLNSLMASRAFGAVARSVLFCMVDPDDDTEAKRFLGLPKNNLGRTDVPTLVFQINSKCVAETDDGPIWTGVLEWLGEVQQGMRSLIETSQLNSEDRTAKAEASVWLRDYLTDAGGRVDCAVIVTEGKKAGYALSTIKRARTALRVKSISTGTFPRQTYWELPDVAADAGTAEREPVEGAQSGQGAGEPPGGVAQSAPARGGRHLTGLTELTGPTDHTELPIGDAPCTVGPVSPVGPAGAPPARRELTGVASPTRHTPSLPTAPVRPPRQTVCKHGQAAPCLQCYADTGSTAPTKRKESSW